MKKIIIYFLTTIFILFICILYIDHNNQKYLKKLEKNIINNTKIENINYINKYDDYYIVKDNKNVYVIDNKYYIVLELSNKLIHKNTKNYDMIYRNETLMYFNDYIKDNKIIYKYYDIYTYELLDNISLGG